MQGLIRCVSLAGLACACGPGDIPTQDDASGPMDSGLIVKWSASPATIPGDVENGLTIHRARFALDNLRVVGDAGPGDPRTTTSLVALNWECASGGTGTTCSETVAPADMTFDDAPPGLYSQVALKFDGSGFSGAPESIDIRGEVDIAGTIWEYRIEGDNPLTFNVDVDKMVNPGEQATIMLRINFQHALDSIDWANMDTSDGRKELETGDSQMSTFRAKLIESFEVAVVGGAR